LQSLISSQTKKHVAPNLLATEITYLAFNSISSAVDPSLTNSLSIDLDSIEDKISNNGLLVLN